ncbi:immunoglobulin kappa light chain-like isoform X6 [Tympanuchus pallidicinctus]|uniref:immunoglobulin kappa light chain-like isoform X6 n=1 Tax=Tympanuchus pallidicinctus TaxID=109042 RepID=UPI002286EEB5|nr:immunoglobulin kappa light chain-like isoform X6 [Tympanuchus pallidicinctus]
MLLLPLLVVTSLWSRGDAQAAPVQSPAERRLVEGSPVTMTCQLSSGTTVHWYRQLPGEPPKRILYMSGSSPTFDDNKDRFKFQAQKSSSSSVLTIEKATRRDTGTYLCAYCTVCNVWIKYFGTGTKLIVSNKGNSGPENSEILRKEHKNQLVYVCLFEKFYPEVVRVKWLDEAKKEVTQNVVKGDVWKFPGEEKYSVSSWLSVPLEDKNKKYSCHFEHESGDQSLLTHVLSSESSPQKNCSTESRNSTVFNRDHLTHKAAQLVYVVLLLKSSMYYVIILFFFFKYRARNAAKPSGKRT